MAIRWLGGNAVLAQPDLARRSFGQTLRRLVAVVGAGRELGELDANHLEFVARQAWGKVGPACPVTPS